MPVYEYRCDDCQSKSDVLWRNFSPPDATTCKSCGGENTHRVISRVAFHKSLGSKIGDLDPRYDKMIDAAAAGTPEGDPYRYLDNMPSIADGE